MVCTSLCIVLKNWEQNSKFREELMAFDTTRTVWKTKILGGGVKHRQTDSKVIS
jgi:hypothetical protein